MGLYGSIVRFRLAVSMVCTNKMFSALLVLIFFCSSVSIASVDAKDDFTGLSLEQLMAVEITSLAKKPQKFSQAAAAVFVITQEDIRRSGATSIPEVLRMVPGIQVARIDSNKWAVSVRGFNGRFANKLLVLMDGRSVYSPYFAGVSWDVQDTVLEDIDRIEVIRGPGGSLWGSNAVNGVINIITKSAFDTQGGLFTAGYGNKEEGFSTLRYGGAWEEELALRGYAKFFNRDHFTAVDDQDANDQWWAFRSGFRMDWEADGVDRLTVQGDIYKGESGEKSDIPTPEPPYSVEFENEAEAFGGNVLARWTRTLSASSEYSLQVYYDRTEHDFVSSGEEQNTVDVDFQHRFGLGGRQEVIWGLGLRWTQDHFKNSQYMFAEPSKEEDYVFSCFLQDEIGLIPDSLYLTLGSKFEHNEYTGWEIQPSGRVRWTPNPRNTIWASVSRAVRTPTRTEHDSSFNVAAVPPNPGEGVPLSQLVVFSPNDDFDSEEVLAFELGYRVQLLDRLHVDLAGFYNIYDGLRSLGPPTAIEFHLQPVPFLGIPLPPRNRGEGETYGVELAVDWTPLDWWRIRGAYAHLQIDTRIESMDPNEILLPSGSESPTNTLSVMSRLDLPHAFEFDVWFRYVSELDSFDIDEYFTVDVRLGWRPLECLELSIVGQNLLDGEHPEFRSEAWVADTVEVPRSVYGKLTFTF